MPIIKKELSVPAIGFIENIFAGSTYEFLPWMADLNLGITGAATGLLATVNTGSDVVQEESPVTVLTRFPVIPDDMDIQDRALPQERIVVKVRNTTGAAITVRSILQLTPVG